jgi:PKD repeat protein
MNRIVSFRKACFQIFRMMLAVVAICSAVVAQNPAASITVDVNANRRAIDPRIYGIAYGTTAQLSDLNVPLNRYGGNNTSRYNWQLNADNRGQDWYFQSIPEPSSVPGERGNTFISTTQAAGARPMVTIPMLDWVARLGSNRSKLASFSQAKYGAQTDADWQWFPDAGNGILASTNQPVQNNDPNDANTPNSSQFQRQWVQAIVSQWGPASTSAPRYYVLDNEPSIWHSTHRDVHPAGATMDEILSRTLNHAAEIRAADPNGIIVGPEEWGWSGYFFSGYDQQYGSQHGWSFLPDRANHGGADYLPWLLGRLKADGRHLLDAFTVHYYPQGGEFSNDTSSTMQLRRNRSTRSLWDPNYVDPTWINDEVMLIPRLRNWADTYYYSGTPIGITEYNWGAEGHINGATTQADILGIFGREGLSLAARWTTPAASTPTYKAIKIYRNYDGNKSTFGDTSVLATGPNADNVSAFAAQRTSDSALTVMVINKYLSGNTPVSIALANFSSNGSAQVYQLTSANAITRLADLSFTASTVSFTAPPQSVTLVVLPTGAPNQHPTAVSSANPTSGVAPLTVNFSSAGSSDPDGSIVSYSWSFGDSTAASTSPAPSHVYQNSGSYTAVLTVTDNGGAAGTAQVSVVVSPNTNVINAPSNLQGTPQTTGSGKKKTYAGSVLLTWTDNSNNENYFQIERCQNLVTVGQGRRATVACSNWLLSPAVFQSSSSSFQDTTAALNTKYIYRVKAVNASASSGYSNEAIVTTPAQ